ncbi:putative Thioredoxin-like superfamily [Helianthus debilis subsp. tardiflorus]
MTSVTSSYFLLPSVSPNKCRSSVLRRNPKKLIVRATRTESKGVSLGSKAPHFKLEESLSGNMWKLDNFESYPVLLDGPVFMAEDARTFNYPFPYLYDPSQDVARAYGAVCTPEFYLFKKVHSLAEKS